MQELLLALLLQTAAPGESATRPGATPTTRPTPMTPIPATAFFPVDLVERFAPEKLPAIEHPAYLSPIEVARAELFAGRPRAALYRTYSDAAGAGADAIDVALVRGESLGRLGHREAALAALAGDDTRLVLARANVLRRAARHVEVVALLETRVEDVAADPDTIEVHVTLGRSLEALGRIDDAIAAYAPVVVGPRGAVARWKKSRERGFDEDARAITLAAIAIDRHATLTTAYARDRTLNDLVLSMLVTSYDVVDRGYWPARLAAAEFYLARDNTRDALDELAAAAEANPTASEIVIPLGLVAAANQSEAQVGRAVGILREQDPSDADAHVIESVAAMARRSFSEAADAAARAAVVRPDDIDTLSRLAAAQRLAGDEAASDATIARIESLSPTDPRPHALIGIALASFYDHYASIPWLDRAIERAPWWVEPRHALGRSLMFDGDDARARDVLEAAYALDPYNVISVNYLRLLEESESYKSFESEHFVWRYAEVDDPIVPLVLAPAMDESYEALVRDFRFEPDRKPIMAIMPDKQSFSVRTAGIPGLETWGASLGRVMTVMAPRLGQSAGPFNWYRVMTHEFVHTLNLMYTRGRVPRWLTEGMAVWQEKVPYRFPQTPPALYERLHDEEPMTPRVAAGILGGRGGARGSHDGELAYMTGFWSVRFIDETMGRDALVGLLTAYRDGLEDDAAFTRALGMDFATFNDRYLVWAREQVSTWGYDEATQAKYDLIEKEADDLTRAGLLDEAIGRWQEALSLQPMNPLPRRRLAGLLLRAERPLEAAEQLKAMMHVEWQDNRFAKRLAAIYESANDLEQALHWTIAATRIDPYDPATHLKQADLLTKLGRESESAKAREIGRLLEQRRDQRMPARATTEEP